MSMRPYGRWMGISRNMSAADTDGDVRDEDVRSRASAPSIMTADPLAPREGTGTTATQPGKTEADAAPLALKNAVGPKSANGEDDVRSVEHALGVTGHLDLKPTGGTTGLYGAPLQNGIKRLQAETGLKQDGLLRVGGPTARLIGGVLTALGADPAPRRSRTSKRLRTEQSSANARLVTHLKGTAADGLVPGLYARAFAENDDGKAETVDFIRQLQRADKTRAARVRASMEGDMTGPQRADLADWLHEADAESDPGRGIDPARRAAVLKAFAQQTRADAPKPPDDGKPDEGKPDDGKPDDGKPDDGNPDDGKPDEGKPDDKPEKPKPDCWKQHFAVREVNEQIFEVRREESSLLMRINELDDRILALKKGDPLPEDDTGGAGPNMPHVPALPSGKKKPGRKDIAIEVGQAIVPFIIDNAREGFEDLVEPFYEFNSDKVRELEAEKAALNEKLLENANKQKVLNKQFAERVKELEACEAGQSG